MYETIHPLKICAIKAVDRHETQKCPCLLVKSSFNDHLFWNIKRFKYTWKKEVFTIWSFLDLFTCYDGSTASLIWNFFFLFFLFLFRANTLFKIWTKYKPRLPDWYYNDKLLKVGDSLAQIKVSRSTTEMVQSQFLFHYVSVLF